MLFEKLSQMLFGQILSSPLIDTY